MKTILHFARLLLPTVLVAIGDVVSIRAQEVSIPDPGLNAAIREALGIPDGPLTAPDLLNLTNLDASSRNISDLTGLESAGNLVTLQLADNQLGTFSFPSNLVRLTNLGVCAERSRRETYVLLRRIWGLNLQFDLTANVIA